ncbi:MAG: PrsW family glutamic-type intramembrane protease [Candidatus Paceibacterota bacterium]|jgi:RsiW-degrading membrane proteinase PrsW (M82 family)
MAGEINTATIFLSLLGGVLPALFWLWFWLREDYLHPEPRRMILATFCAGMISVVFAFSAERAVAVLNLENQLVVLFAWAFIEEVVKYFAVYAIAMHGKFFDEPIDAMIYMVTGALGFAAIENFLFILNSQSIFTSVLTSSMRFIGASLLHVTASAIIGAAIAMSFYRNKTIKKEYFFVGMILAVAIHTLFNFLIIQDSGRNIMPVFIVLWSFAILVLLAFEKAKKINIQKELIRVQ